MSVRGRVLRGVLLAGVLALALPAGAWAHAALLRTQPSPSGVLDGSPAHVTLTYSEAVEPRFAIVSITNTAGQDQATARPARSPGDPDQLVIPVRHLERGWYLVYWRVISADGHPVRGAFTFAVGPNAGPAPQFAIPSLSETAATPSLLIARWVVLLSLMCAVGLLAFRLLIARPLLRRVPGASLRAVNVALAASLAAALLAVLAYLELATAQFALRSAFDLGAVVPLMRSSAFGRGYVDLALALVLLALAAALALWVDRPARPIRSVAELLAGSGVGLGCAGVLLMPGLAGHAAQYAPRGLSLALDALHLLAGSLWIGGLVGLTVLAASAGARRVAWLVVVVPRFSRTALGSVLVLLASGTVASLIRLPTLRSLWETGWGQALLVKIGLLLCALGLAAVNLLRTTPRLEASRNRPTLGEPTTTVLRRLVAGELVLILGAIFAASVLTSLAPPPKALAGIGRASASVGPGAVRRVLTHGRYRLAFAIVPNRAAVPNDLSVQITRDGKPVTGADVVTTFTMLDMEMGQQAYRLAPQQPAVYAKRSLPSLVMVGHWGLTFTIKIPHQAPFDVLLLDKAQG
jgi:copper transport protein